MDKKRDFCDIINSLEDKAEKELDRFSFEVIPLPERKDSNE